MIMDLLENEKILLVHGKAFNLNDGIYFRLVFLPHIDELTAALDRIANFFSYYTQA
jgi:alanine-synthesizing transaminase